MEPDGEPMIRLLVFGVVVAGYVWVAMVVWLVLRTAGQLVYHAIRGVVLVVRHVLRQRRQAPTRPLA